MERSGQIEQWDYLIAEFKFRLAEQKEILLHHGSSFNRGWVAGLSMGLQKASMFSYSLRHNDAFPIPLKFREAPSKECLVERYLEWLIDDIKSKALVDEDHYSDISNMDDFRVGQLFGLQDWKRNL